MRKIKYLVASLLLMSAITNANPVLGPTAATVAENFYKQTYKTDAGTLTLTYTERDADGQPVYYVYDVNTNGGFVIVSAEDAGYPIIGSSNTSHYVVPTTNNNMGYWMGKRKTEIISMRTSNTQATADVTGMWSALIHNTPANTHQAMSGVASLLGGDVSGILWDQSPFYNAYCPALSVTGCVATAMAQIMKYWNWPSVGISTWCYYDLQPLYTENYGELCVTLDTSHYVWSAMPNKVTSANHEVAKLMFDCGVSVNMDYSPSGSGAMVMGIAPSAQNSYFQFFGYNSAAIKGVMQASYPVTGWEIVLENEFNAHRPVQYMGTDVYNGGHSWVCDGYETSPSVMFHMNWGWSGADNGFYSVTSLNPGSDDFTKSLGALVGIFPSIAGVQNVSNNQALKVYPNPSNGVFNISLDNLNNAPQISVYNVLGQQVYFSKLTSVQTSINLSSQSKGVYLYKVLNENGDSISTGRLVIQ